MKLIKLIQSIVLSAFILLLSGCQEIQGPRWSADGLWVAYTVYTKMPDGGVKTSVYLLSPDAEDAPRLLAEHGAYPQWTQDGSNLYYLAERDEQGYFTKIMRFHPGNRLPNDTPDQKPSVALGGMKLTGMQLTNGNGGPLLLLLQGTSISPGAPVYAELWSAADGKRIDLRGMGELYGPALSVDGRTLVYGMKPAENHAILMAVDLVAGGEAKAVFPTPNLTEPDVAAFVVHAAPNSDRFLFYGPGMANVWTMSGKPGANKFARFPIPEGLTCPVMARVAEDSNTALLTFLRTTPGHLTYESYRLDFALNRWTKLDANAEEPIGGLALDPKSKKREALRSAALTASGLSIVDAGKPRLIPITAEQHLAASALMLKANDPEKALEMALKAQDIKPPPENPEALNQALFAAYVAGGKFDRATDIYEQTWLLEPVGKGGVRFMFPPESGLPSPAPEWVAQQLKTMDDLLAAAPGNRMIPLLKQAFLARQKGAQKEAIAVFKKAIDYCPDKAREGGVRFQQGVCEMELGEPLQAAEFFEQAARIEDFPQADLAGAMSVMAYYLAGRPELANKATAVLQLPAVRKSPLVAEIRQLPEMVKGRSFKEHSATAESVSPNGELHAWAEFDSFSIPHVFAKPAVFDGADGNPVLRRTGIRRLTVSTLFTNKSPAAILQVARAVTAPKVSPAGNALAFAVEGEVAPMQDSFCELIVLNPTGTVINGNAQAATQGHNKSRQVLTGFDWNGNSEIKLTGADVDVFGGQKPFETSMPVGRVIPRK